MAAGTQQASLDVTGMVCPGCEATMEALLGDLEGVASVRADRTKETAVVVYDPTVVTPAAMATVVNTATYCQASPTKPTADPAAGSATAGAGGGSRGPPLPRAATGLAVLAVGGVGWLAWRGRRSRQTPTASRQS